MLDDVFDQASSVDSLTENFNDTLRGLLDLVAPAKTRKCPQKNCMPWLNDSLISLRKESRKRERQWHHSKLEVHYQMWHESLITFQSSMSAAKAAYYSNLITNNKHNPRLLFGTVARLTQCQQPSSSTDLLASDFMEYFNEKVEDIRNRIPQSSVSDSYDASTLCTFTGQAFAEFELISLPDLTKAVMALGSKKQDV